MGKAKTAPKIPGLGKAGETAAEWVDRKTIHRWADNPRRNKQTVKAVAASMERYGFGEPLLVRKANREIIAGDTRYQAAELLDLPAVPVRFMDLSEEEAHELARIDNRLGELSQWDAERLLRQLREERERHATAGTERFRFAWDDKSLQKVLKEAAPPNLGANGNGSVEQRRDTMASTDIRQIVLYFSPPEYETVVPRLDAARVAFGLDSNTELVVKLLDLYDQQSEEAGES